MADVAIIYCSVHHGNTKKLVDRISEAYPVDVFDVAEGRMADLSKYKAVGFASGIYMSKLHASLLTVIDKALLLDEVKKSFILYTCGSGGLNYAQSVTAKMRSAGVEVLGVYACKGYDTFGPFKLVGGIAKGHPSLYDFNAALQFFKNAVMAELRV